MGSFNFVAVSDFVVQATDGVHIQMWTMQPIVLLVMVHYIRDGLLFIETLLVDSVLGEVGLYHFELAEMSLAVALLA
jgi:hypothetical protein